MATKKETKLYIKKSISQFRKVINVIEEHSKKTDAELLASLLFCNRLNKHLEEGDLRPDLIFKDTYEHIKQNGIIQEH